MYRSCRFLPMDPTNKTTAFNQFTTVLPIMSIFSHFLPARSSRSRPPHRNRRVPQTHIPCGTKPFLILCRYPVSTAHNSMLKDMSVLPRLTFCARLSAPNHLSSSSPNRVCKIFCPPWTWLTLQNTIDFRI